MSFPLPFINKTKRLYLFLLLEPFEVKLVVLDPNEGSMSEFPKETLSWLSFFLKKRAKVGSISKTTPLPTSKSGVWVSLGFVRNYHWYGVRGGSNKILNFQIENNKSYKWKKWKRIQYQLPNVRFQSHGTDDCFAWFPSMSSNGHCIPCYLLLCLTQLNNRGTDTRLIDG